MINLSRTTEEVKMSSMTFTKTATHERNDIQLFRDGVRTCV